MKSRKRMDASVWILLGLTCAAVVYAFQRDDNLPLAGLSQPRACSVPSASSSRSAFVLAGLFDVLVRTQTLVRWLGEEHAGRGILVGWVVGLVIPGGPYVFFPIDRQPLRQGGAAGPLIRAHHRQTL
jgi:hypothetical protein